MRSRRAQALQPRSNWDLRMAGKLEHSVPADGSGGAMAENAAAVGRPTMVMVMASAMGDTFIVSVRVSVLSTPEGSYCFYRRALYVL